MLDKCYLCDVKDMNVIEFSNAPFGLCYTCYMTQKERLNFDSSERRVLFMICNKCVQIKRLIQRSTNLSNVRDFSDVRDNEQKKLECIRSKKKITLISSLFLNLTNLV